MCVREALGLESWCPQRTWAARCCVRVCISVLHSWTLSAQHGPQPLRLPQCTSLPKQQTSTACLSTLVSQTPQALPFHDCMAARQKMPLVAPRLLESGGNGSAQRFTHLHMHLQQERQWCLFWLLSSFNQPNSAAYWSALLGALVVVLVLVVTPLLVTAGALWRSEHRCIHNSMHTRDARHACQSSIAHWAGKEPADANSAARDWR